MPRAIAESADCPVAEQRGPKVRADLVVLQEVTARSVQDGVERRRDPGGIVRHQLGAIFPDQPHETSVGPLVAGARRRGGAIEPETGKETTHRRGIGQHRLAPPHRREVVRPLRRQRVGVLTERERDERGAELGPVDFPPRRSFRVGGEKPRAPLARERFESLAHSPRVAGAARLEHVVQRAPQRIVARHVGGPQAERRQGPVHLELGDIAPLASRRELARERRALLESQRRSSQLALEAGDFRHRLPLRAPGDRRPLLADSRRLPAGEVRLERDQLAPEGIRLIGRRGCAENAEPAEVFAEHADPGREVGVDVTIGIRGDERPRRREPLIGVGRRGERRARGDVRSIGFRAAGIDRA